MKVYNIKDCARCMGDHSELELSELSLGGQYTHFAICPNKNQPILINVEQDVEQVLDHYHYHEYLDRSWYILNVIETILDHPVRKQNKVVDDQVDKILMECAELYQIVGHISHNFEEEKLMPDIRNKLTPMLTLAQLVEDGHINNPKFEKILKDTVEQVKHNVDYISNLKH